MSIKNIISTVQLDPSNLSIDTKSQERQKSQEKSNEAMHFLFFFFVESQMM